MAYSLRQIDRSVNPYLTGKTDRCRETCASMSQGIKEEASSLKTKKREREQSEQTVRVWCLLKVESWKPPKNTQIIISFFKILIYCVLPRTGSGWWSNAIHHLGMDQAQSGPGSIPNKFEEYSDRSSKSTTSSRCSSCDAKRCPDPSIHVVYWKVLWIRCPVWSARIGEKSPITVPEGNSGNIFDSWGSNAESCHFAGCPNMTVFISWSCPPKPKPLVSAKSLSHLSTCKFLARRGSMHNWQIPNHLNHLLLFSYGFNLNT